MQRIALPVTISEQAYRELLKSILFSQDENSPLYLRKAACKITELICADLPKLPKYLANTPFFIINTSKQKIFFVIKPEKKFIAYPLIFKSQAHQRENEATIDSLLNLLKTARKKSLETLREILLTRFLLEGLGEGTIITAICCLGNTTQKIALLEFIDALEETEFEIVFRELSINTFDDRTLPAWLPSRFTDKLLDRLQDLKNVSWYPDLFFEQDGIFKLTFLRDLIENANPKKIGDIIRWLNSLQTIIPESIFICILSSPLENTGNLALLIIKKCLELLEDPSPQVCSAKNYTSIKNSFSHEQEHAITTLHEILLLFISGDALEVFANKPEQLFFLLTAADEYGYTFPMFILELNNNNSLPKIFYTLLYRTRILFQHYPEQTKIFLSGNNPRIDETVAQMLSIRATNNNILTKLLMQTFPHLDQPQSPPSSSFGLWS